MKTLKLVNDDLVFDEQGNLLIVDGKEEEAQSLDRIFTTHKGEWFLNRNFGFDFRVLKRKRVDNNAIRMAVVEAGTQDSRTERVYQVELQKEKRRIGISFKAKMASGNVLESEVKQ